MGNSQVPEGNKEPKASVVRKMKTIGQAVWTWRLALRV